MSEVKDPAIKLFGKTISLPPNEPALDHHQHEQPSCSTSQDDKLFIFHVNAIGYQSTLGGDVTRSRPEIDPVNLSDEESIEPLTQIGACETPRTPGADTEPSSPKFITKEEPSETGPSQEKTLKRPDKILPCPRCNSMDTKFCYYNNYNVNQPRHFCKRCQRYWTAGGTMRNVPVGSGRRKNKSSCASNYRHIIVSEAFQAAQADSANSIHSSSLKADGTILAFGSERPFCESMVSVLNLAERAQNCAPNGYHIAEKRVPVSYGAKISTCHSNGFCSTKMNLSEKGANADLQDSVLKNFQVFRPQVPWLSGTPWPSQWNSAHWTSPGTQHSFNPSGFPVSFYAASPYWGCTVPSPWNFTWLSPPSSSPNHSALSTSPTSPTLGKHNRDGSMLKPSDLAKEEPVEERDAECSVLLPKTCRIDDRNQAAKGSISSTLEIKSDNKDSVNGAGLFKAFHPTVDEKNYLADTSLILQANPAAFSRSINFREST